jgi:hypothetical protein
LLIAQFGRLELFAQNFDCAVPVHLRVSHPKTKGPIPSDRWSPE